MSSRFQVGGEEDSPIPPPSASEAVPRRIYIRREDVSEEKYGFTLGCKGCEAANGGSTGIHNQQCRKRIDFELLTAGDNIMEQYTQRLADDIQERTEGERHDDVESVLSDKSESPGDTDEIMLG